MEDLRTVGWIVRWAAASMASNLGHLPSDKLDWKPNPASKTALEITGEVARVMRMMMPVFSGGGFEPQPLPPPSGLEEAQRLLKETSEEFAAALEAAGPELERPLETPFGQLWGSRGVVFGMIDLLHHHGQITYLQSLLGDAENHMDPAAVGRWFGPPK
jgi:hypothetical protein